MRIRPHHLLCLQTWVGRGYSEAFTENMNRIAAKLRKHPEEMVILSAGADDICAACPNLLADGRCRSEEKVRRFDAKVRILLEKDALNQTGRGDNLEGETYAALHSRIRESGGVSPHPDICGDCDWYGLCEEVGEKKPKGMLLKGL